MRRELRAGLLVCTPAGWEGPEKGAEAGPEALGSGKRGELRGERESEKKNRDVAFFFFNGFVPFRSPSKCGAPRSRP